MRGRFRQARRAGKREVFMRRANAQAGAVAGREDNNKTEKERGEKEERDPLRRAIIQGQKQAKIKNRRETRGRERRSSPVSERSSKIVKKG